MTPNNDDKILRNMAIGVRRGVARALAMHKQKGRAIHIWKDGQIVEIQAKDIPIDHDILNTNHT